MNLLRRFFKPGHKMPNADKIDEMEERLVAIEATAYLLRQIAVARGWFSESDADTDDNNTVDNAGARRDHLQHKKPVQDDVPRSDIKRIN